MQISLSKQAFDLLSLIKGISNERDSKQSDCGRGGQIYEKLWIMNFITPYLASAVYLEVVDS